MSALAPLPNGNARELMRIALLFIIASCNAPSPPVRAPSPAPATDGNCPRAVPPETTTDALPSGWSFAMPQRGHVDADLVVEGLPMQKIVGVAFSDDDATLAAWDDERVVWYRSATLEPIGGLVGEYVYGVVHVGNDIYIDTYRDAHVELHLRAGPGGLALRGIRRPGAEIEQRTTYVGPGIHVRASECVNCGPKPVAEFVVWVDGAAPRELVEVGRAAAVSDDGTLLVVDEQRIAARALCDTAWTEHAMPETKLTGYQLLDASVEYRPPYVIVSSPRSHVVIDIERGTARRFATYGKLVTSTRLLAYVAHDAVHDEPGELIVIDMASGKEVRRWPPGRRPRAFSHDGTRLVFAMDRGDSASDLHVVRVQR